MVGDDYGIFADGDELAGEAGWVTNQLAQGAGDGLAGGVPGGEGAAGGSGCIIGRPRCAKRLEVGTGAYRQSFPGSPGSVSLR
jgi:hypothetical protein